MAYKLVRVHQPKAFAKGLYSVTFVEKDKPKLDRYMKHFEIKAKNIREAVTKAKNQL